MEPIVYTPDSSAVEIRDFLSFFLIGTGIVVGGGFFLIGLLITILPLLAKPPSFSFAGMSFALIGFSVGAFNVAVGAWLYKTRSTKNDRVILSSDTITYSTARGKTVLRLSDIVALEGKWTPSHWRLSYHNVRIPSAYWTFTIRDRRNRTIAFRVGYIEQAFNAAQIFRDLLARLPDTIPVNSYLADYVRTGEIQDPVRSQSLEI
ncbi:MAG: hypothetical protein JXA21_29200 [Anaerolineae bacterium]|nr:hypothetical protein [Anaerolineae bacterium]